MTQAQIIEELRIPFGFLFDRYEYQVITCNEYANSSNWIVVLESPIYGRFLTLHDRGEIIVALGPVRSDVWTDGPWFDLPVIAEYLSEGRDMLKYTHGELEQQMTSWAVALVPYMEDIGRLFSPVVFAGAHADLDRIGERRENEFKQQDAGDEWNIHLN